MIEKSFVKNIIILIIKYVDTNKNIALLFVLLIGVLGNVFAKKSIEESAVGYEIIKAWETLINHPLIRNDIASLTSVSKILDNTAIANGYLYAVDWDNYLHILKD